MEVRLALSRNLDAFSAAIQTFSYCPVWEPQATQGYPTLERRLVQLGKGILNFIKFLLM